MVTANETPAQPENAEKVIILDVSKHSQDTIDLILRKLQVDWGMVANYVEGEYTDKSFNYSRGE